VRDLYSDPTLARRYDRIAGLGNLALGGDRRLDEVVLRQLALAPGRRVLDMGAGTGRLAPAMAAAIRPGGRLILLDSSEVMLEQARARGRVTDGVETRVGDVADLPYDNGRFDRVLLAWLLHELPPDRRDRALKEAVRVVAGGGQIVVIDHGKPLGLAARAWWKLVRRGLANEAERESLAWHLEHPPERVLADAGLQLRRNLKLAGGLVRVTVAVRPG
jgi:ubiquinone/menaquinone biosynthesis C-methylase UbiE